MSTVKVTVELTTSQAWFLADKAQQAGVDLSTWISKMIIGGHGQALSTCERVKLLHVTGMTDGEIAVRLNTTRLVVAQHRRSLGLPPRKRHAREKNL